jgi:hypothetical protein
MCATTLATDVTAPADHVYGLAGASSIDEDDDDRKSSPT